MKRFSFIAASIIFVADALWGPRVNPLWGFAAISIGLAI